MAGPPISDRAAQGAGNIAVVERSFEALNARDLDGVFECFTEECVFDGSRVAEGVYRGKASYRGFLEGVFESLGELRHGDISLLEGEDDQVVAITSVEVAGNSSRAAAGGRLAYLYRLRDGLIFHQEIHPDPAALLSSLGLDA